MGEGPGEYKSRAGEWRKGVGGGGRSGTRGVGRIAGE